MILRKTLSCLALVSLAPLVAGCFGGSSEPEGFDQYPLTLKLLYQDVSELSGGDMQCFGYGILGDQMTLDCIIRQSDIMNSYSLRLKNQGFDESVADLLARVQESVCRDEQVGLDDEQTWREYNADRFYVIGSDWADTAGVQTQELASEVANATGGTIKTGAELCAMTARESVSSESE